MRPLQPLPRGYGLSVNFLALFRMGERVMQYERLGLETLGSEITRADAWKLLEQIKTTRNRIIRQLLARRAFELAQLADLLENEARGERITTPDAIGREWQSESVRQREAITEAAAGLRLSSAVSSI
jgi:hypothetical protein